MNDGEIEKIENLNKEDHERTYKMLRTWKVQLGKFANPATLHTVLCKLKIQSVANKYFMESGGR